MVLGQAMEEGWGISLQCERRRAGMKSTRPCPNLQKLDLATLVASHGHMFELTALQKAVVCPKCGSKNVSLSFHSPAPVTREPEQGEAGRRQMQPVSGDGRLGRTSSPWIVVQCEKCNRRGEYRRESLLAKYGPDVQLPSLLEMIAADAGCAMAKGGIEKRDLTRPFPCGIVYDIEKSGSKR